MPTIHSLPIYGLDELFAAYGFTNRVQFGVPSRPSAAPHLLQAFACHVAMSFLEITETRGLPEGDGIFVPSPCDTLNNLADILAWRLPGRFVACIDYPEPAASGAVPFLATEISRVKAAFLAAFGKAEDRAAEAASLTAYAEGHRVIRALFERRRSGDVAIAAGAFARFAADEPAIPRAELPARIAELEAKAPPKKGPTILVSGITLPPALADVLDGIGLVVTDDDLAQGFRRFSGEYPDPSGPLELVLARKYAALAPCSTTSRGPHVRAEYVADRVMATSPDGFLFLRYPWCEPEAFDAPPVLEAVRRLGVPAAEITLNPSQPDDAATRTRLEAFHELLSAR